MSMNTSQTKPIATGIDICVRSDSLILENVSRLLGVTPTSGFEKGEPYVGRQKRGSDIETVDRVRPFGVWHFCTAQSLDSKHVEDHAKFLIDTFASARDAVQQLIADPKSYVRITVWAVGYTFDLTAASLAGLSSLAQDFTITCWDDEEDGGD